jgi:hypothetical protein
MCQRSLDGVRGPLTGLIERSARHGFEAVAE